MIKIDTDFNLNVLLKLFFSLSKKIIFFSLLLANNNLPLKIYCENIVIPFPHSSSFFPTLPHFFLLFFPFFFLLHTRTLTLFFFYFFPLFIPITSPKLQNILALLFLFLFFFSQQFVCNTHTILHPDLLDSFSLNSTAYKMG